MKARIEKTEGGYSMSSCPQCGQGGKPFQEGSSAAFATHPIARCTTCGYSSIYCPSCYEEVALTTPLSYKERSICTACGFTNAVPHSVSEVYKNHRGMLITEIIEERSA